MTPNTPSRDESGHNPTDPSEIGGAPTARRDVGLGNLAVAIAIAATTAALGTSLVLSLSRVGVLPASLPGCSTSGGCSALATGPWAGVTLPILDVRWPWAHLGSAWFAGLSSILGLLVLSRWLWPGSDQSLTSLARWLARWLVRIGAGVSLGLIAVMLILQTFCAWCVATHIAGLVAWFVLTRSAHAQPRAGRWTLTAIFVGVAAFLGPATGVTLGLAALESRHASVLAAEAAEDEAAMAAQAAARRAKPSPSPEPSTAQSPPARSPLEGRWRSGKADAPVEIVVFSDYECPDCKRIDVEIESVLARGDVSVVAKQFPLCSECNPQVPKSLHPDACRRAALAEAAGALGGIDAFRAAHTALFSIQRNPRDPTPDASPVDALATVAEATRLDPAALSQRAGDASIRDAIAGDIRDALSLGVTFTPMVFVNGREWKWYQTRGRLTDLVDRVITQSEPKLAPPSALEKMVEEWRTARTIAELSDDPPPFLLRRAEERSRPVPQVRLWVDYTVPGSAILADHLAALATAGTPFDLWVDQFPASSQCNAMIGLPEGAPESCVGALAACAAGIVGGEEAFRATHAWLLAHPTAISLTGLGELWDGLPGGRKEFLAAFSDGRARTIALGQSERLYRKAAVTSIPILMVNGRIVPRWDHPGAPARELLGAILAEAAKELASSGKSGEVAEPDRLR